MSNRRRTWRSLLEAMAWVVARDEHLCDEVGASSFAAKRPWYTPGTLLLHAMRSAGCFLPDPMPMASVRFKRSQTLAEMEAGCAPEIVTKEVGRWTLAPGYTGRFQDIAESYERDGWCTRIPAIIASEIDSQFAALGLTTLEAYLCSLWTDAFDVVMEHVSAGRIGARGQIQSATGLFENRDIPPPSLSCKPKLPVHDWILWEGPEQQSRSWTEVQINWDDLLRILPSPGASKCHVSTIGAEAACLLWLTGKMRASPLERPQSKQHYYKQACEQFLGIGGPENRSPSRAFERCWSSAMEKAGTPAWGRGGRPKKSPH